MIRKYLKYYALAVLLIYLTSSVGLNIYAHHCACVSSESYSVFTEANWHSDHHHSSQSEQVESGHSHSCCGHVHNHFTKKHHSSCEAHSHNGKGHCSNFKDLVESVSSSCDGNSLHQGCSTSHMYVRVISFSSSSLSYEFSNLPVLSLLNSTENKNASEPEVAPSFNTKFSPQKEQLSTLERIYVLQCPKVPSQHFLG